MHVLPTAYHQCLHGVCVVVHSLLYSIMMLLGTNTNSMLVARPTGGNTTTSRYALGVHIPLHACMLDMHTLGICIACGTMYTLCVY